VTHTYFYSAPSLVAALLNSLPKTLEQMGKGRDSIEPLDRELSFPSELTYQRSFPAQPDWLSRFRPLRLQKEYPFKILWNFKDARRGIPPIPSVAFFLAGCFSLQHDLITSASPWQGMRRSPIWKHDAHILVFPPAG